MTYKFTCPGCQTATSDNSRGFLDEGACPKCGLSGDVIREIWRVRESHATDEVKTQFEQLATRAGVAEAKVLRLERRLERIKEAVDDDGDY
jgi:hypothetical protein